MKIKIIKKQLVNEGYKETESFLTYLNSVGFVKDVSDKRLDHTKVNILKRSFKNKKECFVKIVLIGPTDPSGRLYLSELFTPKKCRNKGYARKVMNIITKAADKYGVRLELTAYPLDDTTQQSGLEDFYSSLNFKKDIDKEFYRDFDHNRKY